MEEVLESLENYSEELIKMDSFDECIIGICLRYGQEACVAYDYDMVIAENMAQGMTYEEAVDYFYYNQIGAYVGDHTPCFVEKIIEKGSA